jgi:hypothetical protein
MFPTWWRSQGALPWLYSENSPQRRLLVSATDGPPVFRLLEPPFTSEIWALASALLWATISPPPLLVIYQSTRFPSFTLPTAVSLCSLHFGGESLLHQYDSGETLGLGELGQRKLSRYHAFPSPWELPAPHPELGCARSDCSVLEEERSRSSRVVANVRPRGKSISF